MMSNDKELEQFTQQLQAEIMEKIGKVYTETVIDHWQNPRNFRRIKKPDGYGKAQGTCGDTMEMFIKINEDRILDCSFQTDGCGTSIVCGSMATVIAINKTFTEALAEVSASKILSLLGGLPEADKHCASLAAETLRRAMADLLYHKKFPWKKIYRKEQ